MNLAKQNNTSVLIGICEKVLITWASLDSNKKDLILTHGLTYIDGQGRRLGTSRTGMAGFGGGGVGCYGGAPWRWSLEVEQEDITGWRWTLTYRPKIRIWYNLIAI